MKPRIGLLFSILLLAIPPTARADNPAAPAPADTVAVTIQPKRVSFTDVTKSSKAIPVTVSYLVTNNTADTQVINLFCTIDLAIKLDDGHFVNLRFLGADGFGIQGAIHLLTIAPRKQQTLVVRLFLNSSAKGFLLERDTEDGGGWGGDLPPDAKFIDIAATYTDRLTRDAIEKLHPELKGARYTLPDLKLPPVRLEFAK
ncbi:MAG TPA: hypothetical protein VG733_11890 [Chthoniobacteraceae bacterium]|nr:hypothetical protein [Chthoniobacteraceae bacterium]